MTKRMITTITAAIAALMMCAGLTTPVAAYNYDFSGGAGNQNFGKPTSDDSPITPDPMGANTRRNKDAAYNPPPFGFFGGNIPTDPGSLYHDNAPSGASGYGVAASVSAATTAHVTNAATSASAANATSAGNVAASVPGNVTIATAGLPTTFEAPTSTLSINTAPKYYADGSIGTLYVERTGATIKVYEGEEPANLKKGAGHFSTTSAWDGNVALCGHNRGSWPYFAFVKDLRVGDRLTYTTLYGARIYEVFSKERIAETDYGKLGWAADNVLTLVTCVIDTPELRWAAQAREVK